MTHDDTWFSWSLIYQHENISVLPPTLLCRGAGSIAFEWGRGEMRSMESNFQFDLADVNPLEFPLEWFDIWEIWIKSWERSRWGAPSVRWNVKFGSNRRCVRRSQTSRTIRSNSADHKSSKRKHPLTIDISYGYIPLTIDISHRYPINIH